MSTFRLLLSEEYVKVFLLLHAGYYVIESAQQTLGLILDSNFSYSIKSVKE